MTSSALAYGYSYPFDSAVETAKGRAQIRLATSGGAEAHPYFFTGILADPVPATELLLLIARVAQSRFYVPPAMVARLIREADPVVTCGGERLRFESFSQCCGVYARGDFLPAAIAGDFTGRGTTNVDFNEPMRAALAQVGKAEEVGLKVGADRVELERTAGSVVERKVKLPLRWLKGFVEVQAYARGLKLRHEIPGPEARRFLGSLSAQVSAKDRCHLVVSGRRLRLSQIAAKGALEVGGIGRLKVLAPLAKRAKALKIYGSDSGVSGWEVDLGSSRLELILSPEASRGFSGEGQVLAELAGDKSDAALSRVRAALAWQAKITPADLSQTVAAPPEAIAGALATLGSRGLVGYDIAQEAYFHREIPFDLAAVEALHPRLKSARRILEAKAVRLEKQTAHLVEAYVKGSDVEQRVVVKDDAASCSCPWFSKNRGAAGPCKHILAVQILLEKARA